MYFIVKSKNWAPLTTNSAPSKTEKVTAEALNIGFRHVRWPAIDLTPANSDLEYQVDSAIMYGNEKPCGIAIQGSGLDRSEIFFTTKIPPESMGYDATKRAVNSSLRQAGQEYFDL